MPKKKTAEYVPTLEEAQEPKKEIPAAKDCYYVWNERSEFVQSFHEDDYKGEAKSHAEALASQHEGWTVS